MLGSLQPEGEHRRVDGARESRCAGRVVGVVVGHQHRTHAPGEAGHLSQVLLVIGSGIDHDRRFVSHDPGVGALERVDARVRREDPLDPCHRQSCQNVERCRYSSS